MIPVVDMSRHQGWVEFATLRTHGVQAVIIRVAHGDVLDTMCETYYNEARKHGYDHSDIGFYSFINPKRGTAKDTADFAADNILRITGGLEPIVYMVDIENYRKESPDVGQQPLRGQAFAQYIEDHLDVFEQRCPTAFEVGYTNRSYWNSPDGPNSIALAQQLEWIVSRYPVYSERGYQLFPVPVDVDEWETWAYNHAPDGPYPPIGGTWSAWQFSAGFNNCGPIYGASSDDLDLNIFHADAFQRMFRPAPPNPQPSPEDQMNYYVVTGATARFIGTPTEVSWTGPGTDKITAAVAVQLAAGNLVQVDLTGGPNAFQSTFLQGPLPVGDTLHEWTGDEFAALLPNEDGTTADQVARDMAAHANAGVDNIDRRLANTAAHLHEAGDALT